MPKEEFTPPTGEKLTLIYGAKHPGRGTTYLNAARMGPVDEKSNMAVEYHAMESVYGLQLAQVRAKYRTSMPWSPRRAVGQTPTRTGMRRYAGEVPMT